MNLTSLRLFLAWPHRAAQPLHPLLCKPTQSVPLPSISTSPVTTHRGSSLVENAQLYQLIFLSKTNYPSWVVWLTERALTPSRRCYWCDLVLAPRSAFLLSTLLAYFPSTFIQHHEHYLYSPPRFSVCSCSFFLLNTERRCSSGFTCKDTEHH